MTNPDKGFGQRLDAYRSSFRGLTAGRSLRNWPAFAAAAGSALAMASTASANSIISGTISNGSVNWANGNRKTFAGVGPAGEGLELIVASELVTSPVRTKSRYKVRTHTTTFGGGRHMPASTPGSTSFGRPVQSYRHYHSKTKTRYVTKSKQHEVLGAGLFAPNGMNEIFDSAKVGTVGRVISSGKFKAQKIAYFSGIFFAGARWYSGGKKYLGWVELDSTTTSIDVLAWAYNSVAGQSILTGQTSNSTPSPTPEPSTAAMGLLAAGAAGVRAWRRARAGKTAGKANA